MRMQGVPDWFDAFYRAEVEPLRRQVAAQLEAIAGLVIVLVVFAAGVILGHPGIAAIAAAGLSCVGLAVAIVRNYRAAERAHEAERFRCLLEIERRGATGEIRSWARQEIAQHAARDVLAELGA